MVSLTRAVIGLGGRGEIKQGLNGLHNGPINFDVRSPGGGGGGTAKYGLYRYVPRGRVWF